MRIESVEDIAVMRLEGPKANAISPDWLKSFQKLLEEFNESSHKALVITGHKGFFCAGLDLVELSKLDSQKMGDFIEEFSDTALSLFQLERPVVVAINGHAIAGGCIFAQQADYRVMAKGKGKIGVKEVALGVGIPVAGLETIRSNLKPQAFYDVCINARLYDSSGAVEVGLVDAEVEAEELESTALEKAKALASHPALAFAHVKQSWRRPIVERISFELASDTKKWLMTWFSEEAQARIAKTIEGLTKKS